jgi:hypothetical protein
MSASRQQAENLLVHYISRAWEAAGLNWDSDNDSEVRLIVDNLTEVAVAEVRESAPARTPAPAPVASAEDREFEARTILRQHGITLANDRPFSLAKIEALAGVAETFGED